MQREVFALIFCLQCLPLQLNMKIIDSVLLLNYTEFCLKEISRKKGSQKFQFPEGRIHFYLK